MVVYQVPMEDAASFVQMLDDSTYISFDANTANMGSVYGWGNIYLRVLNQWGHDYLGTATASSVFGQEKITLTFDLTSFEGISDMAQLSSLSMELFFGTNNMSGPIYIDNMEADGYIDPSNAIPEPRTYGILLALLSLGLTVFFRRKSC